MQNNAFRTVFSRFKNAVQHTKTPRVMKLEGF